MRFLFDNQLAPHLAGCIHALIAPAGHEAIHLRTKFKPDTIDVEWIKALSQERNWVVISGDRNILRVRAERAVWKDAGLIGFFLKKGWMSLEPMEQAWRLVKWWPTIMAQVQIAAPGSTFEVGVQPTGKLESPLP